MLMSVPNVSEGADPTAIDAVGAALSNGAHLLDIHRDPDHGRSVYTLAGEQGSLSGAVVAGAAKAIDLLDISAHRGVHPHVGAVDVAPIVYLNAADRGAACAEALVTAHRIGDELGVPVFLYGELSGGRERADLRSGGVEGLSERMVDGVHRPDFGPETLHPTAGATLVSARPPLVAFNLVLADGETAEVAKQIAAELRESGGGLPGVRAIGLWLTVSNRAQVSCNIHDPFAIPLSRIVEFVRERAAIQEAELVGLAPRAAFDGFPQDLPVPGFDPSRHLLENILGPSSAKIS
jgi:glutamate formiminotransferase/glutamate formiminotransferase/formiminotetrahydrofolate cyclodeaminase